MMIHKEAKHIAIKTCYLLQDYCEPGRIKIAGSVRRGKHDCHDIEIVLQPKTEFIKIDLFDNQKEVRIPQFIEVVSKLGKIVKGKPTGKLMQIMLPENIMLDMFMPEPRDFFRMYAVRTGSATYSQKILASGWNKIGWCGSDQGLRKKADCIGTKTKDGKMDWKCVNPVAELPPVWEDEKHFFEWLGVKWILPELRSIG